MTNEAIAAAYVHALTEFPCKDCDRPRWLDPLTGSTICTTGWCFNAGADLPLGMALDQAGIDYNPPGRTRPLHGQTPVPWLTPISELGPHSASCTADDWPQRNDTGCARSAGCPPTRTLLR